MHYFFVGDEEEVVELPSAFSVVSFAVGFIDTRLLEASTKPRMATRAPTIATPDPA